MKRTQKIKYLTIYKECLQKKYYNASFEPLLELLYRLVLSFEKYIQNKDYDKYFISGSHDSTFCSMGNHDVTFFHKGRHDKTCMNPPDLVFNPRVDEEYDVIWDPRCEFVKELVDLFPKIVNDNKQDEVLDVCNMFLQIGSGWSKLPFALKSFFYPKEANEEDSYRYHTIIMDIISSYTYETDIDSKYFRVLPNDLRTILDSLKKYRDNINPKSIDDVDHKTKFVGYMNVLVNYFYKNKYDINIFPKAMEYVFNHAEDLDEFRRLNDPKFKHSFEDVYISRIIDICTKPIPVIK